MISIGQLIYDKIPEPTLRLNWGENIPREIYQKLKDGEVAILFDENGNPYSEILIDYFGTIRERKIK